MGAPVVPEVKKIWITSELFVSRSAIGSAPDMRSSSLTHSLEDNPAQSPTRILCFSKGSAPLPPFSRASSTLRAVAESPTTASASDDCVGVQLFYYGTH